MSGAISFDFATKEDRDLDLDAARAAHDPDKFLWVNISGPDVARAPEFREFFEINNPLLDSEEEIATPRFTDLGNCIYFSLQDIVFENNQAVIVPVHVYFGKTFMLTIHRRGGQARFIEGAYDGCRRNFRQVAKSPGFLLFELADHMTQAYTRTVQSVAGLTGDIEGELYQADADDSVFTRVAELMRSILIFYKIIVASREVVHDLANRLSPFIPETTQPFLDKKAALLDRLSVDVTTEREILSESLNLYMGIVTHRTNHVVNRLTILSTFFLPLGFLVGVYGMNFRVMPELQWQYGYTTFWMVVTGIVGGLLFYMKRQDWL